MDPINTKLLRQLIRALERLEHALSSKASLGDNGDAEQKNDAANQRDAQPEPPRPPQVVMGLPPSVTDYYAAEQKERPRKARWEILKRGIEVCGLLIALWLGWLTNRALREVHQQADAAQRQLEATDRPWIKITQAILERDLTFFKDPTNHASGLSLRNN